MVIAILKFVYYLVAMVAAVVAVMTYRKCVDQDNLNYTSNVIRNVQDEIDPLFYEDDFEKN